MENAIWPGWRTVRVIGSGSFGTVYEIERDVFGETEKAALKVITIPQDDSDVEELRNEGYDDVSITLRFQSYLKDIVHEYSLMAKIKGHSNVVYCDDIKYIQNEDGVGWTIYIKMELLTPLMKTLQTVSKESEILRLGKDICCALIRCQKANIIHRDIKPQNIFVSKDGVYKLGDFGIAKTAEKTMGGTKIGTYKYMAPEVYNNQPYGVVADLYSLGMVLYWLLNERRTPFLPLPPKVPTASEEENSRYRRFRGEPLPPPAHGSEQLKQIVLKACAFSPTDRYPSAEEMLRALETVKPVDHAQTEAAAISTMAKDFSITEQNASSAHLDRANHADEQTVSIFSSKAEAERSAEATDAAAQHAAGEPPFAEEETVSAAAREQTEMIVTQPSDTAAAETQAWVITESAAAVEDTVRSADTVLSGSGVQPKKEGRLAHKGTETTAPSIMESDVAPEVGLQTPCRRTPIVERNMGETAQTMNTESQEETELLQGEADEQTAMLPVPEVGSADGSSVEIDAVSGNVTGKMPMSSAKQSDNHSRAVSANSSIELRAAENNAKKGHKKWIIALLVAAMLVAAIVISVPMIHKTNQYDRAMTLYDEGKYSEAEALFTSLDNYKDSESLALDCRYQQALQMLNAGDWDTSKQMFLAMGDYSDAASMLLQCDYVHGQQLLDNGEYDEAKTIFLALGDYSDAASMLLQCDYVHGQQLLDSGEYDEAKAVFLALGNDSGDVTSVYEFVYENSSWLEAQEKAAAKGGHLACFETKEEYEAFLAVLEKGGQKNTGYFFGGRREIESSEYYWVDAQLNPYGEAIDSDAAWCKDNWLTGEPSFIWNDNQETVMQLYYSTDDGKWVWNDVQEYSAQSSFTQYGYIIEYEQSAMAFECDYRKAGQLLNNGDFASAKLLFERLGSYADSDRQAMRCDYHAAQDLMNSGEYEAAGDILVEIPSYQGAKTLARHCYVLAVRDLAKENRITAAAAFLYQKKDIFDEGGYYYDDCDVGLRYSQVDYDGCCDAFYLDYYIAKGVKDNDSYTFYVLCMILDADGNIYSLSLYNGYDGYEEVNVSSFNWNDYVGLLW